MSSLARVHVGGLAVGCIRDISHFFSVSTISHENTPHKWQYARSGPKLLFALLRQYCFLGPLDEITNFDMITYFFSFPHIVILPVGSRQYYTNKCKPIAIPGACAPMGV